MQARGFMRDRLPSKLLLYFVAKMVGNEDDYDFMEDSIVNGRFKVKIGSKGKLKIDYATYKS